MENTWIAQTSPPISVTDKPAWPRSAWKDSCRDGIHIAPALGLSLAGHLPPMPLCYANFSREQCGAVVAEGLIALVEPLPPEFKVLSFPN